MGTFWGVFNPQLIGVHSSIKLGNFWKMLCSSNFAGASSHWKQASQKNVSNTQLWNGGMGKPKYMAVPMRLVVSDCQNLAVRDSYIRILILYNIINKWIVYIDGEHSLHLLVIGCIFFEPIKSAPKTWTLSNYLKIAIWTNICIISVHWSPSQCSKWIYITGEDW